MAVLASLAVILLPLATAHPPPFQCPPQKPLSTLTCEATALAPLPHDAAAFCPWTHEPHCLRPAEKPLLAFCVFTNDEFHGGMSLVTLPELGVHVANRTMSLGPGGADMDIDEDEIIGQDKEEGHTEVDKVEKKYEQRVIEGKGRALVLKEGETLKAGEVVFVDYPSLLIARDALDVLLPEERHQLNWLGFMQLPDEGRAAVRGMVSWGRYADEVDNVVAMNALGVQYGGFKHLGVFPEAAKINHDCTPNLYYRFDEASLSLTIFALRDISPGEELTYTYLDPLSTPAHTDRQAALTSQWSFTCTCPLCADAPTRRASNRRRESIRRLKTSLSDAAAEPARIVQVCRKLLGLYEEEGLVAPRGMVAEVAAYAANQVGDVEGAVGFARMARGYWGVIAGEGSVEVRRLEGLIRDPRGHESYRPGEGVRTDEKEEEEEGDVVMDAVRAAMKGAKRRARERGVEGEEEEEGMVEEAVRAALRGAMSRDEL